MCSVQFFCRVEQGQTTLPRCFGLIKADGLEQSPSWDRQGRRGSLRDWGTHVGGQEWGKGGSRLLSSPCAIGPNMFYLSTYLAREPVSVNRPRKVSGFRFRGFGHGRSLLFRDGMSWVRCWLATCSLSISREEVDGTFPAVPPSVSQRAQAVPCPSLSC